MNIYLQMMILGMYLKYCYALTRIQKNEEEMKWHLIWRKLECYQALLYFPSTLMSPFECVDQYVQNLNVFRLDTTPEMFDVWKPT